MSYSDRTSKVASFTFVGELLDFFKTNQDGIKIVCEFKGKQSVKHLVESLHVPHTEVGDILVNGKNVDFSYLVEDGDEVFVLPACEPDGIIKPRFVIDNHLGKLATFLRIFGFDVLYRNDFRDEELAKISIREERVLLTRDRGLLMRREITRGYWIRSREPREQLVEVLQRFALFDRIDPLKRCLKCNNPLEEISKQAVLHRLKPLTKRYYDDFRICHRCNQIYWKGSHYERMVSFLTEVQQGG